jgi:hypothetical protein
MAPKRKTASGALADIASDLPRQGESGPFSPLAVDNIRVVMEPLHAFHTRFDEHAKTKSEQLRRDALRDHPTAITIDSAATYVAANYMSTSDYLPPPSRPVPAHRGLSQRFTIDHAFAAQTVYKATDFDGDSLARSFRMDAPLMPKTGEFKSWKRDFPPFCRGNVSLALHVLVRCAVESNCSAHRPRDVCTMRSARQARITCPRLCVGWPPQLR